MTLKKIFDCLVIFIMMAMVLATHAMAKVMVVPSLEWMTESSPVIIRGHVIDVDKSLFSQEQPLWTLEDVSFKVTEVIKGDAKQPYVNFMRVHKIGISATDWKMQKSDLIVFLKFENGKFITFYELPFAPINLDHLAENTPVLANSKVIRDKEEILKIIKNKDAREGHKTKTAPDFSGDVPEGAAVVEIPENTEGFRSLWTGSKCYLVVPK